MTTIDYATPQSAPLLSGRTHFLIRRLHSLTGLVFGGYLIVHLLINATIAQGGPVYQNQVNKIHDLPFLPVIEWTAIYLPLLFHTVYGIYIAIMGRPNVDNYSYPKNWNYVLQRASAIIIVFFAIFHVLAFKYGIFGKQLGFEPHRALPTVVDHFNVSFFITWILYPLGILASCFHLSNGFWTAAITWGLTISAKSQRRWGFVCLGLFVVTLVAGMTALIAGAAMSPETARATLEVVNHSN